jgi:hypothetical protein
MRCLKGGGVLIRYSSGLYDQGSILVRDNVHQAYYTGGSFPGAKAVGT